MPINTSYTTHVTETAEKVKQALAAGWGGSNAYGLLDSFVSDINEIVNKQNLTQLGTKEVDAINSFKEYILGRGDVTSDLNKLNGFLKTIGVKGVSLSTKKEDLEVIKSLLQKSVKNESHTVSLAVQANNLEQDKEQVLDSSAAKADADISSNGSAKVDAGSQAATISVDIQTDTDVMDNTEATELMQSYVSDLFKDLQLTTEQAEKIVSLLDNQKAFSEYLKLVQMVKSSEVELKDNTQFTERLGKLKDKSLVINDAYTAADSSSIEDSAEKADFEKMDKSTSIISKLFSGLTLAMVDAVIEASMINASYKKTPTAGLDAVIKRVETDALHKAEIAGLKSQWEAAKDAASEDELGTPEKDKDAFAGKFAILDQLSGLESAVTKFKAFANSVNHYADYLKKERTTLLDRVSTYFDGERASSSVYYALAFSAIAAGAAYFVAAAAISGALYTLSIAAAAFGVARALSIANVAYNGKVSFNEVSPLAIDGKMAKLEVFASVAPLAVSLLAPVALPAQTAAAAIGYTGSIAMRAVYSAVASIISFTTESFNLDLPTFVNKAHYIDQVKALAVTDEQLKQAVTAKAFESFKTSVANVEVQEDSEDENIKKLSGFKKALADMSADDVDVAAFRPIASIDTKVNKDTLGKSDRVVDLTKVFVERLTTAAYSNPLCIVHCALCIVHCALCICCAL